MNNLPDSTDSGDPLEHDLYRAFSARSSSIDPAAPPFDALGAPSQHPRRVLLVAASVALIAVGGLAFANLDGPANGGRGVADGEVSPAPTNVSSPSSPADPGLWACTGPIDPSADGPADDGSPTYWRTCTAVSDVDTITTITTIVVDATAPATTVEVDASASDDVATSTSTILAPEAPSICTVPGGCDVYTVAAGDNPTSVAEQFCVTATELAAANNWLSFEEFPQPGANILVPPDTNRSTCLGADS
jgi:hypothetical protein